MQCLDMVLFTIIFCFSTGNYCLKYSITGSVSLARILSCRSFFISPCVSDFVF